MNPGDTSYDRQRRPACRSPLNEGRGVNPGDTAAAFVMVGAVGFRSTKAEV